MSGSSPHQPTNSQGVKGKLLEYVVSASSSPVAPSSTASNYFERASEDAGTKRLSPLPPKSTPTNSPFQRGSRSTSLSSTSLLLRSPSSFLNSPVRWGALAPGYAPNLVPLSQHSLAPANLVPELALSAEPMSKSSVNLAAGIRSIGSIDDIDLGSDGPGTMTAESSVKSTPKATKIAEADINPFVNDNNHQTEEPSATMASSQTPPLNGNTAMEVDSPIPTAEEDDDDLLLTPTRPPSSDSKPREESWIYATSPPHYSLSSSSSTRINFNKNDSAQDSVDADLPDLDTDVALLDEAPPFTTSRPLPDSDADVALLDEAPPFTTSRTQSDLYLNDSGPRKVSSNSESNNSDTPHEASASLVNASRKAISEFDPLNIPLDWMLNTPVSISKTSIGSRSNDSNGVMDLSMANGVSTRLIDITSPKSMTRYSERDVERIKADLREQLGKESERETRELRSQCEASNDKYRKIQSTLAEWEQAMQDMIADSQKEKEISHRTIEKQRQMIDQLKEENTKLAKERDRAILQAKQANVLFESSQKDNEDLKESIELIQRDVDIARQRYDVLKAHAEEKLESANVEIAKVRATYEKEISGYKIRISKAELQASSLEKVVAQRTNENIELTKICDQLLAHVQDGTS
ncbi:hypothetical protein SeMB42_g04732 [Synchytrium endobioticum]|uniref:Transforming acidic coiled-coil-containing protein C-terminal domain-containing protein n=1 Tax=Synchytrium endobioticum TaxID=286115 RepID=A0A507CYR4_9FUNG|nr:hypothetical protein SeMB42_g04732 [Synchytrium endobioticum]TPX44313.1 hypothetical protein SeLEV6574_g04580 [Synchytrium endobioticum]